jgi:hypothetical protein
MKNGATYDFDSYIPHVSFSYDAEHFEERLSTLPLPPFDLYIAEEYVEQLNDNQ